MMNKNSIQTFKFKDDIHAGFEVLPLDKFFEHKDSVLFSPHRADFYHIIFFTQGAGNHVVDFNAISIASPSILFVNKGMVHVFDKQRNMNATAVLFTEEFYAKTELDLKYLKSTTLFNDPFHISKIQLTADSRLASLWKELEIEHHMHADKNRTDIFRNLLTSFLLIAERELVQQGNPSNLQSLDWEITLAYQDLLDKHYRKIKKVNEYSKLMGLTDKKLSNATMNTLGKTPKQLFNDRLVLEIKRLLAHGHESIKEISYELGFDEPTNFVKYFKKHTAVLPSDFRDSHLLNFN